MTGAAEAPAPLPPGAAEAPVPAAGSPAAADVPAAAEASAPAPSGTPGPPQDPAKIEVVNAETADATRSDDGDEAPSTTPAHEVDECIALDSGLVDVKLVEAPEPAPAPAPEPPKQQTRRRRKKKEKAGLLTKVYNKWLHTCDHRVRKLREPYRCTAGFLVQAAFAASLIYFAITNFTSTYFANYLSADNSPAQGSDPAARECKQPFVYITDTYRVDTDGTWSSRYAFWAPNGLVEASFFRFNATDETYDQFGAELVSGLVKFNKQGANQTLLEQLMTLTMSRFMVMGDTSDKKESFENTNTIGFTGDARVWLDRQEVSTDLFAWNVGTATITDKCDVQMVSSVIDG